MKPTQDSADLPVKATVRPRSVTPIQPFMALLARYKARVYEAYADRICAMEDEDWFTRSAGIDPPAPDKID